MSRRQEGTTYGNVWMYKVLIQILRHVNIRILYVFMAVFVIPFTLLFSPGARITFRYFHRVKGHGRIKSLWYTYRNHCIFGETVIDKFAMYAGHKFSVDYRGLDEYEAMTRQPYSIIQLSAHIGCSEIVGYSYDNAKASNVLVYGKEKEALMRYREQAFGNKNIKMIPVGADAPHSEEIIKALDRNEIICTFADRVVNAKKTISSTLHGCHIDLARGPFSLAVTRGLKVIMTCAMKERNGSYTAYLIPLEYDKLLSKRQQCQQLADAYSANMELLLGKYPMQWFNYSDFWERKQ